MLTLVTTVTCRPASRRCSAAVSPATPEPITTTSVGSAQPGWGPASRRGSAGSPSLQSTSQKGIARRAEDHASGSGPVPILAIDAFNGRELIR